MPKIHSLIKGNKKGALILEFIDLRPLNSDDQIPLARKLTNMHQDKSFKYYGWSQDNYIGKSIQKNIWSSTWPSFFFDYRLFPQIKTARLTEKIKPLERKVYQILSSTEQSSFIHGDLWSGNVSKDEDNQLVVYDPACSVSDPLCELSIMQMFGGFSSEFFTEYLKDYNDEKIHRKLQIYQLYHYLNHLNIFGDIYKGICLKLIHEIIS